MPLKIRFDDQVAFRARAPKVRQTFFVPETSQQLLLLGSQVIGQSTKNIQCDSRINGFFIAERHLLGAYALVQLLLAPLHP
jgi:hypothetical protein